MHHITHCKLRGFCSTELKCVMRFAVYLPPAAETGKVPVLYWLSGTLRRMIIRVATYYWQASTKPSKDDQIIVYFLIKFIIRYNLKAIPAFFKLAVNLVLLNLILLTSAILSFKFWECLTNKLLNHLADTSKCGSLLHWYLECWCASFSCLRSGLTCTEQNFITKAGVQKYASELGLIIVAPDTSPRESYC